MKDIPIPTRITSLERWGMRVHGDFSEASAAYAREAGYTGVFANGGSGMGPDMLPPESLVSAVSIRDLMPLTVKASEREMQRRCGILKGAGLKPWLCVWGVSGPDESHGSPYAESNRFFDRQTKLEMQAKLRRTPEIFGFRHPESLSWRGSRPLCVSHPAVQGFYRELYSELPRKYPDLEGVFFFPGDHGPELCDDTCPRCRATGLDPWGVMLGYVNEIYAALRASRPDIAFYFTIWNQDHPRGRENIGRFLQGLAPGIGICMSLSDNVEEIRKCGRVIFNQPWSNVAGIGDLFRWTAGQAVEAKRPVMALGEISQSEVWDPVCHNMPLPLKTLAFLRNADSVRGVDALCDFWGNRSPFLPHANHAIMREYFQDPKARDADLLRRAAHRHYGVGENTGLPERAVECWTAFDRVVDDWALAGWAQRFSFAIGRDAARGRLYEALLPAFLREAGGRWEVSVSILHAGLDNELSSESFADFQTQARTDFLQAAGGFADFGKLLEKNNHSPGAALAGREARNIELAGELIASEGRTVLAIHAWQKEDWPLLRHLVEEEIDSRERQLEISAFLSPGGGVHPLLVREDIQNMRLFLSSDEFPQTPDEWFHFTATPYST